MFIALMQVLAAASIIYAFPAYIIYKAIKKDNLEEGKRAMVKKLRGGATNTNRTSADDLLGQIRKRKHKSPGVVGTPGSGGRKPLSLQEIKDKLNK